MIESAKALHAKTAQHNGQSIRLLRSRIDRNSLSWFGTMNDNPYQSPNIDAPQSQGKHRSFRLTTHESDSEPSLVVGTFRNAITFSLITQIPLLLLGASILDGGLIFRRFLIASLAYWTIVLIIRMRSRTNISDTDILLAKWGYWPILLVVCLLWVAVSAVSSFS